MSYETLSRQIRQIAAENGQRCLVNKSAIAHWVAGTRPQPQTTGYLVEALSRRLCRPLTQTDVGLASASEDVADNRLPDDPVAAIASLGRADVDRRTLINSAAFSVSALVTALRPPTQQRRRPPIAGRVGQAEVDAVREMTRAYNAADERLGGGHARSAVVEYLVTDVASYLRGQYAHEATRKAMFGAAAQLAYLAGWKAHDFGLPGLAQKYYLHSFQLADEADPHAHAAYGLRILAHQALDLGRHEHCADLAEAALSRVRGHTDPQTESLFWLTAARANAATKSRRPALAALHTAEQLINRVPDDEGPQWAALGGPAEARLSNQAGKTLQALGDLTAAEAQFRRSAACWNPRTHPRIHALTLADLAETQIAQGYVDRACGTWAAALPAMTSVHSARTAAATASMRRHLTRYRNRGHPHARQLLQATTTRP